MSQWTSPLSQCHSGHPFQSPSNYFKLILKNFFENDLPLVAELQGDEIWAPVEPLSKEGARLWHRKATPPSIPHLKWPPGSPDRQFGSPSQHATRSREVPLPRCFDIRVDPVGDFWLVECSSPELRWLTVAHPWSIESHSLKRDREKKARDYLNKFRNKKDYSQGIKKVLWNLKAELQVKHKS